MKRVDFCDGWAMKVWGVPGETPVRLPHDHSQSLPRNPASKSGSAGGWFQGANVVYEREIDVTEDMLSQRVALEFEGVLPGAEVYLDDMLIIRQPYGYLSFHADLTPRLRMGRQRIRVNVHGDALPASRWYVGTGICRPVWLLTAPRACVLPWGLHAQAERGEDGLWRLRGSVHLSEEARSAENTLRLVLEDQTGVCLAQEELRAQGELSFHMACPGATPWSPESPALYRLRAELRGRNGLLDKEEISLGLRTVTLDREKGLLLNGEPIKLRGGCAHHDNGLLGAAAPWEAEYRKARLIKSHGFNAVRCAHNPPSPAFLDACDETGLLVMDEFTDMWNIGKNPYDYHLHFRDRWREDLKSMILRDRNHPSIILWSIGNEIPERDGSGDGYALCRAMCEAVREMDTTRPVTAALNNIGKRRLEALEANLQSAAEGEKDYFDLLSEKFLAPLDVAGYNYLAGRYEKDLAAHPARLICGAESVAKEAFSVWRSTLAHPRVIGDFAWAAIDYLGEAGIGHVRYAPEDGQGYFEKWPWRQANCADIDLCGNTLPAGYYRRAVWGELDAPFIAAQHPAHFGADGEVSYWGWPERFPAWDYPGYEGRPIRVEVYSASEKVELLLNGASVGVADCHECVAAFTLAYQPGLLEARDDRGLTRISTPGRAAALRLTAEVVGSLAFVTAQIEDEKGIPRLFDPVPVSFMVSGGELLAVGSADPASEEGFQRHAARSWRGRVSAVVRVDGVRTVVSASAPGLPSARWSPEKPDEI